MRSGVGHSRVHGGQQFSVWLRQRRDQHATTGVRRPPVLPSTLTQQVITNWINESYARGNHHEYPSASTLTFIWSSIVSIFNVGGMIGALLSGLVSGMYIGTHACVRACVQMADRFGRRGALLYNNIWALCAALIMALTVYFDTYWMLIIGRLLYGINAGVFTCRVPVCNCNLDRSGVRPGTTVLVRNQSGTFTRRRRQFASIGDHYRCAGGAGARHECDTGHGQIVANVVRSVNTHALLFHPMHCSCARPAGHIPTVHTVAVCRIATVHACRQTR